MLNEREMRIALWDAELRSLDEKGFYHAYQMITGNEIYPDDYTTQLKLGVWAQVAYSRLGGFYEGAGSDQYPDHKKGFEMRIAVAEMRRSLRRLGVKNLESIYGGAR